MPINAYNRLRETEIQKEAKIQTQPKKEITMTTVNDTLSVSNATIQQLSSKTLKYLQKIIQEETPEAEGMNDLQTFILAYAVICHIKNGGEEVMQENGVEIEDIKKSLSDS